MDSDALEAVDVTVDGVDDDGGAEDEDVSILSAFSFFSVFLSSLSVLLLY